MRAPLSAEDGEALRVLADAARLMSDGHFTVFGFTTNWKACLRTPASSENDELSFRIPSFTKLREAVRWALKHPEAVYKEDEIGRAYGDDWEEPGDDG